MASCYLRFRKIGDAATMTISGIHEQVSVREYIHLTLVDIHAPVFGFFRANGNKLFIGREPIDGIQCQIAVRLESDHAVIEETGSCR